MNFIESRGKTIFTSTSKRTKANITISILSRRAAFLVLKQSVLDKWLNPVFAYIEPIYYKDIILVGFQPKSGYHIAIKSLPERNNK